MSVICQAEYAFDVERFELAGHLFSREMHPPNPRPESTACAVTRATSRNWPQPPLSRYSLFLLSLRTMGYKGEQCSGGRSILRTHGQNPRFCAGDYAQHRRTGGNSVLVGIAVGSNNRIPRRYRGVAERESAKLASDTVWHRPTVAQIPFKNGHLLHFLVQPHPL